MRSENDALLAPPLSDDVIERAFARWRTEVTCRPTIGEYLVYDRHLYRWLLEDDERLRCYADAIRRAAPGQRVVDVGSGATAPLAIMCARAGALHVDAIEAIPEAADAARSLVARLGLSDTITVHCGSATSITLSQAADLCVSEVIGMIGSAEGAVATLTDVKRLLRPGGRMLPQHCLTWFAPATQVANPYVDDDCIAVTSHYADKIRRAVGYSVPLTRIVTFNFPDENVLAEKQLFELLDFSADTIDAGPDCARFVIARDGIFDGFVLWIELHVDDRNRIDAWRGSSWAPVFLAATPCSVEAGDIVQVDVASFVHHEGENPSYRIYGEIVRAGIHIAPISINSCYA
jgi:protein arginine N-methyltransferase 1